MFAGGWAHKVRVLTGIGRPKIGFQWGIPDRVWKFRTSPVPTKLCFYWDEMKRGRDSQKKTETEPIDVSIETNEDDRIHGVSRKANRTNPEEVMEGSNPMFQTQCKCGICKFLKPFSFFHVFPFEKTTIHSSLQKTLILSTKISEVKFLKDGSWIDSGSVCSSPIFVDAFHHYFECCQLLW